jgi:Na+/H+ antiporter NhaA
MSLFIAALAFPAGDLQAQNQARLGVVLASLLSAGAGMAVLSSAEAARTRREAAGA